MATTTPNLGLPRPEASDNVTLANEQALIDAIDGVAVSQTEFDAHKNDDSGAHAASAISVADTGGNFTATDVEAALAELFQNVSDGKTTVAAAITGMGQSALGSMTFAQLAAAISAISTDANAGVGDVLSTKTFYQGGVKRTGTMPNRGAVTITPGASAQAIQAGYHNGSGVVQAVAGLSAGNIKDNAVVGGVTGTFSQTASGATAAQILAGRQAAVNGSMITGTMPDRSGDTTAISSAVSGNTLRLRTSEGYRDGVNDYVTLTDADFDASKILAPYSLFGKTGTAEKRLFATGTAAISADTRDFVDMQTGSGNIVPCNYITVNGLGFQPKVILAYPVIVNDGPMYITTYNVDGYGRNPVGPITCVCTAAVGSTSPEALEFFRAGNGLVVNGSTFTLPVNNHADNYVWIAYG